MISNKEYRECDIICSVKIQNSGNSCCLLQLKKLKDNAHITLESIWLPDACNFFATLPPIILQLHPHWIRPVSCQVFPAPSRTFLPDIDFRLDRRTRIILSNIYHTRNSDGLRPSSFSLLRRAGRALRALLGTSGPILSSSIQKYTYNIREGSGVLRTPSFLLL